jgi:hypothetical protein
VAAVSTSTTATTTSSTNQAVDLRRQQAHLRQLRRLLEIERVQLITKDPQYLLNEEGFTLLRQSTFSAYCDCLESGAAREAQNLLRYYRDLMAD